MALGEYVSVSSQSDSEHAQIAQEKRELASTPEAELTELTALYEAKGLSAATARTVAVELTAHNPLAAHLDAELHIDPANIPNPVQAAAASALSFTVGAALPMLAILLPQRPPCRPAGGRGRGARPGFHLRRRVRVRHRRPLSTAAGQRPCLAALSNGPV
jgi:VIT family